MNNPSQQSDVRRSCSPILKVGEVPFIITAVQALLLLIAWCLACVTLVGASDNHAIMENSAWGRASSQRGEVYLNFWGICYRSQASSISCTEWTLTANPQQKNAKNGLIAMAGLGWIALSAFMVAVSFKFFAQTPNAAKTLGMTCSVCGALAWLFSLATWAQAADGWLVESTWEPAADGGLVGLDFEWGPGFGASVTQWMFVMIALVLNVVLAVKYSPEANPAGVDTRQGTHAPTLKHLPQGRESGHR